MRAGRWSRSSHVASSRLCDATAAFDPLAMPLRKVRLGTGRSSSYQTFTMRLPFWYAAELRIAGRCVESHESTVAFEQSCPSLQRFGVMNANVGGLFGSNSPSGRTSVSQKSWSVPPK